MDDFLKPSILLIGAGRMGGALAKGWLEHDIKRLTVVEPTDGFREKLAKQGIKTYAALKDCPESLLPDMVVLAVKPAYVKPVLGEWKQRYPRSRGVVLSIAAGVTIASMQDALGEAAPVVRVMPNLPAVIGEGVFGAISSGLGAGQRAQVHNVLSVLGPVAWLEEEAQMDAVTALSGSGPAYLFHFIEAMQKAGEKLGLPRDQARMLTLQTVKGAALLATQSGESASALREQVTSPQGTTEAALKVLMREGNGLTELMQEALLVAARRSSELAQSE
jgi:pyrroline-5-carboxylate reductase